MVEFKIQLEENFVKTFGQEEIEKYCKRVYKNVNSKIGCKRYFGKLENY